MHLAGLQDPQQADLEVGRHLTDLVQEECASLGLLEHPQVAVAGTGIGPLLVAEEFVFQERLRDGAAVDGHEGALGAGAQAMDRTGGQLLSGPGLPLDQHGLVEGREARQVGQGLGHGPVAEQHPGAQALRQAPALTSAADVGGQPGGECHRVHRLLNIVARPAFEGPDRTVHAAVSGNQVEQPVGMAPLVFGEQVQALTVAQLEVGEHGIGQAVLEGQPGLEQAAYSMDVRAQPPQDAAEAADDRGVVVDQQDRDPAQVREA